MNLKPLLRSAQQFVIHNSPAMLSALGCVGLVATAVLSGKAAYSTALILHEANDPPLMQGEDSPEPLTRREEIELVWRQYIPPVVVGVVTLAAIIGANRIGTRRAAAFATAYKLSEKMAEEYRQKVAEAVGDKKEELIRSDVARDRIQRVDGVETIILTDGEIIFYDAWSARAFKSTIDRVESAVNQINYQLNQNWAASVTEFYDILGLEKTGVSDDFG
jgi:hypothetical protein